MITNLYKNVSLKIFMLIYRNCMIYNQCQEDPILDKIALNLKNTDSMLVITSAGCNILDYLLDDVRKIYAIDSNWRQNALLELKIAMIKHLDYETFFSFFGKGSISQPDTIYRKYVRNDLSLVSQSYWDKNIHQFDSSNSGFYFSTAAGNYAKLFNWIFRVILKKGNLINFLANANSLEEQIELYSKLHSFIYSKPMKYIWSNPFVLMLLGVPPQQFNLVKKYYGNVPTYFNKTLNYVMTNTFIKTDNYFWYLYLMKEYTKENCPAYLKEANFLKLKEMNLHEKISIYSSSVTDFLKSQIVKIDKFVLLDSMDWMSHYSQRLILEEQWNYIFKRASENSKIIWRSVGTDVDWMSDVRIIDNDKSRYLFDCLKFYKTLGEELNKIDRYHSYGSFHIADILF